MACYTFQIYYDFSGYSDMAKGRIRTTVNLFIVFFITGLWHGAAVNFVLW
jgi:D-alanyl-lipoteichoic acid acyltransferase DltB (MBOAT superfamily)